MGKSNNKSTTVTTTDNIEETVDALPEDALKLRLQWAVANAPELATEIQNDPTLTAEQIDEKLTEHGVPTADELSNDSEPAVEIGDLEVPHVSEGHDIHNVNGTTVTGTDVDKRQDEHVQDDKTIQAIETGDDPLLREGGHLNEQSPDADTPVTGQTQASIPSPADVVGKESAEQTQSIAVPELPKAKASPAILRLTTTLDGYVKSMGASVPHAPQEGADIQRQFYRGAIENILYTANSEDFLTGMQILLDTIEENITGVFGDRYAFRYWEHLALPRKQTLEFEHILRLLTHIAPKENRKDQLAKHKAKLDFTLGHMQNDQYRERFTEYLRRMMA